LCRRPPFGPDFHQQTATAPTMASTASSTPVAATPLTVPTASAAPPTAPATPPKSQIRRVGSDTGNRDTGSRGDNCNCYSAAVNNKGTNGHTPPTATTKATTPPLPRLSKARGLPRARNHGDHLHLLVANMASYAICSEFDFGDSTT
jgi:hypothetical protein